MPRKKREASPTGIYHWIVRGMNKKDLFHEAMDYGLFKKLVREYKEQYLTGIYHYCLMTNHVHMLIHSENLESISKFSHYVQRRYAYYYSKKYEWTGSVFQRGYKGYLIDREEYLLECGRYVERNPLKAGLVDRLEDYQYMSYRYYAYGDEDDLVSASPAYLGLSDSKAEKQKLYKRYVSENRVQEEMMLKGLLTV